MTYVSTPELLISYISFANEAMLMTWTYKRPTLSADFRFYDVVCYSAYSRERDGFAEVSNRRGR